MTLNYILVYLPAKHVQSQTPTRRDEERTARKEEAEKPAMLLVCFSLERERKGGTEKKLESGMKNFIQRTGGSFNE